MNSAGLKRIAWQIVFLIIAAALFSGAFALLDWIVYGRVRW